MSGRLKLWSEEVTPLSETEARQIISGLSRVETTLQLFSDRLLGTNGQRGEIPILQERVANLEETRNQQSGMLRVLNWLWGFAVLLFGGIEAYERLHK